MKTVFRICPNCYNHIQFKDGYIPVEYICSNCGEKFNGEFLYKMIKTGEEQNGIK